MEPYNVGLVGWGVVGGGVIEVLQRDGDLIRERCGLDLRLVTVVDADLKRQRAQTPQARLVTDIAEVNRDESVRTVIHLVPGTGIARDLLRSSLEAGKHVITANKALLAEHGDELFALAAKKKVCIAFEAAVAGGIPVIAALRDGLVANRIESIHAILNGTCNYILTKMERDGLPYVEALKKAQQLGYAESDPTLDVSGHDTAHKLAILARIAFMGRVDLKGISVEGIQGITPEDLESAKRLGCRVKLLAVATRVANGVVLKVAPTLIPLTMPIANVMENYNAVLIHASNAGPTLLVGQGAGSLPTASAVVSDLVDVAMGRYRETARLFKFFHNSDLMKSVDIGQEKSGKYARMSVPDKAGMLASICQNFSNTGISLLSINQSRFLPDGCAVVEVTTHPCLSSDFSKAMAQIEGQGLCKGCPTTFSMV